MTNPFRRLYFGLMFRFLLFLAAAILVVITAISALGQFADGILIEYSEEIIKTGNRVIRFSEASGVLDVDAVYPEHFAVEVLKENEVIYRQGSRLGGEERYSQEEINGMIQRHYRFMKDVDYIPDYIPFTGTDGAAYALIIKIPKNSEDADIKAGVMVPEYLVGSDLETAVFKMIRNVLLISVAALLVIVFFLSRITWTAVIRPLRELNAGLREVNAGRLDTVLDFRAHIEFEQVRNAFNDMSRELQKQREENLKLSEGKKQFILDISHDLRTPITTISGYSEALVNGMVKTDEEREKYLKYIRNKSLVMADLINRLFDYSRLESGKETLRMQQEDMAACFRNTIIGYYGELESAGFEMEIQIPEQLVPVVCSRVEMERAVGNIIANQIKYNPSGTRVLYALEVTEKTLLLTLKDEGIGIEEKVLDRIFDVMVRGDESRHGVSGTGLGLAITKKVIELHGGTVGVKSRPGEGTVFYISIPKINEN